MTRNLPFSCLCSAISGTIRDVGPKNGDRIICHCRDCQAFAHFCAAADRVLDRHGGTDLYQARCASVQFDRGRGQLACVHLTDKPTLRWYCSDCRTPLFNTFATAKVPYVTTFLANCDPQQRELAGPVKGHLFVEDAPDGHRLNNMKVLPLMLRVVKRMAMDVVSGDRRRAPLFDPQTLAPIVTPHRLAPVERADLDRIARNQ